jgi:hypothetical protein
MVKFMVATCAIVPGVNKSAHFFIVFPDFYNHNNQWDIYSFGNPAISKEQCDSKSTHPSPSLNTWWYDSRLLGLAPSPKLVGDPLISTIKHHFGAILY